MTEKLLKRVQNDALEARKARDTDKGTFLTTLYSEAAMVGKNDGSRDSSDDEVLAVVRKFLKDNIEAVAELDRRADTGPARATLVREQELLRAYLPQQATSDDIKAAVAGAIAALPGATLRQMGAIMGQLEAKFGANYDRKLASTLVKEALAQA